MQVKNPEHLARILRHWAGQILEDDDATIVKEFYELVDEAEERGQWRGVAMGMFAGAALFGLSLLVAARW